MWLNDDSFESLMLYLSICSRACRTGEYPQSPVIWPGAQVFLFFLVQRRSEHSDWGPGEWRGEDRTDEEDESHRLLVHQSAGQRQLRQGEGHEFVLFSFSVWKQISFFKLPSPCCRWCWLSWKAQMKFTLWKFWKKTSSFKMMMWTALWQRNAFWPWLENIPIWLSFSAASRRR